MLDIAFAKPALPKSGALVLLVGEGEMPSGLWQQADEATGGAIARALTAAEFKGGKGKTCTILAPGAGLSRVVAVGLGKPRRADPRVLEEAGGHAARGARPRRRRRHRRRRRSTAGAGGRRSRSARCCARYRFDRYRTKEKPEDKPKLAEAHGADRRRRRARGRVGAAARRSPTACS